MATAVLHPDPQKFPAGATVKAYARSDWPPQVAPSGTPPGTQVASATVATDGSVTFTGLADGTRYVIYAASPDRYASFSTPVAAASTGGTPDDASVTLAKIAPALLPSGTAAASDEALRALGTTASKAAAGNDSRFSDSRAPSGAAGGDLMGSYPNPGRGDWFPGRQGFLGATFDPVEAVLGTNAAAGFPHFAKIYLPDTATAISKLWFWITGATAGATFAKGAIYSSAGVLLAQTADLTTVVQSTGLKQQTLTAEAGQALPTGGAGVWIHAAVLFVTAVPALLGASSNALAVNANLADPDFRHAHNGSGGRTTFPATRPALTTDAGRPFWMAVS